MQNFKQKTQASTPQHKKVVVLAGAGHAHLEVIALLKDRDVTKYRFILVSQMPTSYYSGLLPRWVEGGIEESELEINAAGFASAKGVEFIDSSIREINQKDKTVKLDSGEILKFDILSLNVGGEQKRLSPSEGHRIAYVRPLPSFFTKWQHICEEIESGNSVQRYNSDRSLKIAVVGGGPAAVELATALHTKINRMNSRQLPFPFQVYILAKSQRLCPSYSDRISNAIATDLERIGVQLLFEQDVVDAHESSEQAILSCGSGKEHRFDYVLIATPTLPTGLMTESINKKLQVSEDIFAVGDCAKLPGSLPWPRSGVIAVHQGRHLYRSLLRKLNNQSPEDFISPNRQLNLLISDSDTARAVWGGISFRGRALRRLKNWIDTNYVRRFKDSPRLAKA